MSTLIEFHVFSYHNVRMAKKMVNVKKPWIEVAPPLVIHPTKISHSPNLETIKEEEKNEDNKKDHSF